MADISLPPLVMPPPVTRDALTLKILDLPTDLNNLRSAVRLNGEVIARLPDQSIILRTMAGDMRLQNNASPRLQPGDKMTIEVPAVQTPRQVIIRPTLPGIPVPPPGSSQTPPMPPAVPPGTTPPPPSGTGGHVKLPPDMELMIPPRGTIPPVTLPVRLPLPLAQTLRLTPVATPSLLPPAPPITTISVMPRLTFPIAPVTLPPASTPLQIPAPPLVPPPLLSAVLPIPMQPALPRALPITSIPLSVPTLPTTNGLPLFPLTPQTPQPAPAFQDTAQDVKIIATLPPAPQGVPLTFPATTPMAAMGNVPRGNAAMGLADDALMLTLPLRPGQQWAIVTGLTARQQPVITLFRPDRQAVPTPYILHYPTQSLPPGSRLIVTLPQAYNLPPSQLHAATPQPSSPSLRILPGSWPEFSQLLLLAGPSLSPILERQFPRVGGTAQAAQLTGPAGLLLALMRGGTLGETFFMPDDTGMNAATRQTLLKTIQTALQDIASTQSTVVKDQDGQSWRPIPLPLLNDQGMMDRVMLYIPRDLEDKRPADRDKNRKKALRFVLAARLSRMGDMQLEGLYRADAKTLDAQVISDHPFSGDARNHIARLYARALIRSDLSGDIFFHLKNAHWHDFTTDRVTSDTLIA
ncbi:MAG: hypothetical protein V4621_04115 [Pseudomonadota bacterium]